MRTRAPNRYFAALVLAMVAATGLVASSRPARAQVGPIHRLGTGAWTWFTDPRAVQIGVTTITGWVGTDGSIVVASYNETTGQQRTINIHPRLQYNDHATPSLYLRRDGRLTAFYSAHTGSRMLYRTTVNPAPDITAWGPERAIDTNTAGRYGYTYSNPLYSPLENRMYLFWRGGSFLPTYSTSTTEGDVAWAPARNLINDNDPQNMRPYVKYSFRSEVIHMAYTQAHPRDRATSIFYLKYVPGRGWTRAGGTLAGGKGTPPFIPTDGDRVYNAWQYGERAWVHDIAVDAAGNPRIVFATFIRSENYRRHWYWYARWTGSQWLTRRMTYAGPPISSGVEVQYSAGITLDHENPNIVYLSRKAPGWGVFKVEVWGTPNGGTTWNRPVLVERGIRPVSVRRDPENQVVRLLYLHGGYGSYSTYTTEVRITGLTDSSRVDALVAGV